jgi:hypothetical protein
MTERRNVNELKPGPIRHREVPAALVTRIQAIRLTLDEVYPKSIAEWLDGFQRDVHPESEVLWWERLARCYAEYTGSQDINAEQREALFNVILKLMLGSPSEEVAPDLVKLPHTALHDIAEIMRRISKEQ